MTTSGELDTTDVQILRTLQYDARLTVKEISAKVSLSPTAVHGRIRRLERSGYIKGYTVILDAEKLNYGFAVFCKVKLGHINSEAAGRFSSAVSRMAEVTECYNISGSYDYLLKIGVRSMAEYKDFVLNRLGTVDNISSIESVFVMDEVKHCRGVRLPEI